MRKLIRVGMITLVGVLLVFCGSAAAKEKVYTMKFLSIAPEIHPTGKSLADALRRVEERTGGKLKIDFLYIGQSPYKGNEAVRLIRDGLVDGTDVMNGYCVGDLPYLGVAELPFMFPEYTRDYHEFYATGEKVWNHPTMKTIMDKEWNRFNAVVMGRFYWGINEMSIRQPVNSPEELKNLQFRDYSPEGADALKAIGASAATMTAADVYTALQRGTCDGLISSLQTTLYAKWYEVCKAAYILHFRCSASHVIYNNKKINALPPEYQQILKEETQKACDEILEFTINDTYRIEKWMADELKWTVVYPSNEEYKAMRAKVKKEAWPKWLKRMGEKGKPALDACLEAAGDTEGM